MSRRFGLRWFLACVIVAVVAAVGYGIFLVGSPAGQRLSKFDERRVAELESISHAVDAYWDRNRELPGALEDLKGSRYFVQSVKDPATGEQYEYRALGKTGYELCAVFATDSARREAELHRPFSARMAKHRAGRVCFQLEVEPRSPGT